ncbi:MAG: hypothetical protein A2161_09430 [Candidatus Schekmanbacteria bacterium RBG_13_48_7]|uniref:Uncharacterized protein n=1 Tax=Candidatus Schekmanbacteria bacterium RBG_13_48_7 TaxID=1817878 RepID=A0A1F7RZH2_9BACT|nr:MAG: hypothetical protein A2161_09430 [Candidatus Schekmanbacteria bacterium RBG_13_48_7]
MHPSPMEVKCTEESNQNGRKTENDNLYFHEIISKFGDLRDISADSGLLNILLPKFVIPLYMKEIKRER